MPAMLRKSLTDLTRRCARVLHGRHPGSAVASVCIFAVTGPMQQGGYGADRGPGAPRSRAPRRPLQARRGAALCLRCSTGSNATTSPSKNGAQLGVACPQPAVIRLGIVVPAKVRSACTSAAKGT